MDSIPQWIWDETEWLEKLKDETEWLQKGEEACNIVEVQKVLENLHKHILKKVTDTVAKAERSPKLKEVAEANLKILSCIHCEGMQKVIFPVVLDYFLTIVWEKYNHF